MGILTNLLDTAWREQDVRRKEEQDRYATIAQIPGIRPEIQEWAIDQLTKTAPKNAPGIKDIGGLFKGLIKRQRGGGDGGFQQALEGTGRPGMTAQIPAGPGPLANALPAQTEQVPGVRPSMMLSPQEQLNLKLDEFRQTERIRNDLNVQMQDFLGELKLKQQTKQDEQTQDELQRRISIFTGVYGKEDGVNMAYSSMNLTPPIKTTTSNVPGLVLGTDPELQAFLKKEGLWESGSENKQYHVVKDASGKIVQALEGPAKGQGSEFSGTFKEVSQAQAVVDEFDAAKRTGRKSKYTESDYKAAKDFLTKYNRPPTSIINLGEKKKTAQEIGDAIIRREQPPILTGMGMGGAAELRAYLARKGYNLSQGMEDWQATTRHIASLNSSQQLRLRQATNFAFESLDLIDNPKNPGNDLIGQLRRFVPRSQYPLLNKAAINSAKNGIFGDAAASAARQLESQITDLQSELATVYKGGNSPTDVGLNQAGKMLAGEWSENTLRDAVDLSRKNLRYRLNSIANSGPQTASGEVNPYYTAPKAEDVDPTPRNRAAIEALPNPARAGAKLDAETARKFLDAFSGDKQAAFDEATKRGWKP